MERFEPKKYKRGDSVTVYDGDTFTTILYYWDAADPDVFGDGGAYSITDYTPGADPDVCDLGVLSGYETPADVARDLLSDDLWLIVESANDCVSVPDLFHWLQREHGIDGKALCEVPS